MDEKYLPDSHKHDTLMADGKIIKHTKTFNSEGIAADDLVLLKSIATKMGSASMLLAGCFWLFVVCWQRYCFQCLLLFFFGWYGAHLVQINNTPLHKQKVRIGLMQHSKRRITGTQARPWMSTLSMKMTRNHVTIRISCGTMENPWKFRRNLRR
jgi:hypothetical protein